MKAIMAVYAANKGIPQEAVDVTASSVEAVEETAND
jgi:hypothetical protein